MKREIRDDHHVEDDAQSQSIDPLASQRAAETACSAKLLGSGRDLGETSILTSQPGYSRLGNIQRKGTTCSRGARWSNTSKPVEHISDFTPGDKSNCVGNSKAPPPPVGGGARIIGEIKTETPPVPCITYSVHTTAVSGNAPEGRLCS